MKSLSRSAVYVAALILTGLILTIAAPRAMAWGCHASNPPGTDGVAWNYPTQREASGWAVVECKKHARQHGESQACRVVCSPAANTRGAALALPVR